MGGNNCALTYNAFPLCLALLGHAWHTVMALRPTSTAPSPHKHKISILILKSRSRKMDAKTGLRIEKRVRQMNRRDQKKEDERMEQRIRPNTNWWRWRKRMRDWDNRTWKGDKTRDARRKQREQRGGRQRKTQDENATQGLVEETWWARQYKQD